MANSMTTQQKPGQYPSNIEVNTKDQCNAIHLHSGTTYQPPPMPLDDSELVEESKEDDALVEDTPTQESDPKVKTQDILSSSSSAARPAPPFPQRLIKKKLEERYSNFLDILKKVHINIPLIEALQQMLDYAKFLKDVVSQKMRLNVF